MENVVEDQVRDRWVEFLDSCGVCESDREWRLELEIWSISPVRSRPGYWQVKEHGAWSLVMPWELAQMLWSGIITHAEDCGPSSLAPGPVAYQPLDAEPAAPSCKRLRKHRE